jgi:hypothetical protein
MQPCHTHFASSSPQLLFVRFLRLKTGNIVANQTVIVPCFRSFSTVAVWHAIGMYYHLQSSAFHAIVHRKSVMSCVVEHLCKSTDLEPGVDQMSRRIIVSGAATNVARCASNRRES